MVALSYNNQKEVNTSDRDESELALPGFPFGISGGIAPGRANFFDPVVGDFVDVVPENTNAFTRPAIRTAEISTSSRTQTGSTTSRTTTW